MTAITILREVLASLAYVAQIVAVGILIYAARAYLLQRQQLNYNVITNCTQRFQDILPGLFSNDDRERKESKLRYVDLCNEELFYFSKGYVPDEVMREWIDGMVLYLPHRNHGEWCSIREGPNERHRVSPELLDRYSRIWTVFDVGDCYDTKVEKRRAELVDKIHDNIERMASNS